MTNVLEDPAPLQLNYVPDEFQDRENEASSLKASFAGGEEAPLPNLHVHGPRGTGKTQAVNSVFNDLPKRVSKAYVPCHRYDTQYKALKQICKAFSQDVNDGHHTSELQRRVGEQAEVMKTVVILDEIDFLLLNDGDDLLYFLSRLENSDNISVITISSNTEKLESLIEERTYSSLQPRRIGFEPYTGGELYQILAERAKNALASRSLQREALTYIASSTSNVDRGLTWLRYAAKNADNTITEELIREVEASAYQEYVNYLLDDFTEHHYRVYEAVFEASEEGENSVRAGEIYEMYQDLCRSTEQEALSNRRVSDYIKNLELLDIVQADYYYGGEKGKTREVELC
ncbi:AAA family ATPase [Haloplanus salinus]|uniref:AAA family ATPase n=1 Tax=Haloplanus salinus TaxID=1126245 RepID=A0A368N9T4_9EURY|nr:AAA family ATPase [Haloplanus salinus]RCU47016.1 AAA family ATPase [Haloplanus salinus]